MNDDDNENLRKEYQVCFDNWRFLVGLRFTEQALFVTLNAGLFYAFLNLFVKEGNIWFVGLPPIIGIFSVVAALMIENRNRQLYYACIVRAKVIEHKLGLCNNDTEKTHLNSSCQKRPDIEEVAKNKSLAVLLVKYCPTAISSSHTWGIRVFYIVLLFMWMLLLGVGGVLLIINCFS
jgi:hypothetical protein